MKMEAKNIFGLAILMVILFSGLITNISAYPDYVGYVNDYAHLLSAPQASSLNQELRDFDNSTTIELAVVTVNSLEGESPENYATNIANYWGVGKRGKDNGIIFLVAMDSHDIWIEVGSGLSGQFTNSQVQQIVDDVVIPRFREGQPDQGIIDGVHSIIQHFEGTGGTSAQPVAGPAPIVPLNAPSPQAGVGGSLNPIWSIAAILVIACLGGIFGFKVHRQSMAKKNEARLIESRKLFDDMVGKESAAIVALKELKGNYAPSVWKGVEEAFIAVDPDKLELGLLEAERASKQGWGSAGKAQSLIDEWNNSMKSALKAIYAIPEKLDEVKSARAKSAAILAGLGSAFSQAESETAGGDISMATRMDLEKARQTYRDLSTAASQPPNEVDWIVLLDQLTKLEGAVEQVSKDAVRDKSIARQIQGQNPDEMLAKMKETLDAAEEKLGSADAARDDMRAARESYARTHGYRTGDLNAIDLYLIMTALNSNVSQGYRHQEMAIERARAVERERATAVHHTGFGSSGSRSFGGGRMGGGSHGGGKW